MRRLIILSLLFVPLFGMAQESVTKDEKFSIGVNFSPNYSYRTLHYQEEMQPFVDARERDEYPSFGFNTGISARYIFIKNFELELGVQFSRQTSIFKNVMIISGTMASTLIGVSDCQYRYHYLEFPFRVNYRFLNRKLFGYITAGVSMNRFLNTSAKSWITFNNGETDVVIGETSINNVNKSIFAVLGGLGIGYNISEKLNVRFEVLYRHSLTPLANAPIKQYNYSMGCQMGVNIKL